MRVNHTANVEHAVKRIVQPYVSKRKHVVLSVGILRGGERLVYGFGDLRPFGAVSYDNLMYEIGSITKVFTTSLLALLIAEGSLRPDDSLGKFEPSLPGRHPVTLAHLAAHTSGLPGFPVFKAWCNRFDKTQHRDPYCHFTPQEAFSYLRNVPPGKVGRKFHYSNEGTGILGRLLTTWLGTDYETAITERLCEPLHLTDTGISLPPEQQARMVPGYAGKDEQRPETLLRDYPGAGALRSTLNDQLTFLSAHLGGHPNEELCQDLLISQQTYARHSKTIGVGLGWIIDERGKFAWHNGSTHGFSSFMGFHQDRSSGIVVLSNYRSGLLSDSVDRIGLDLLDLLKRP
ncbi:serine hydrolase domain-containing protein [Paenibacillus tyrfis]|uniref:Beta-lactamase-related domain-containing protein n=1 Tax=Paenibacillus tyrfis TaxID=1501230 RepID=A0A081P5J4_9BACL|nr:serine hydrolase domain-containing protein [Paenibacillus tyrfis]KEQ25967.1 hypothetical protein ET33_35855 [Paenibacillus tyrfis]